MVFSSCVLCFCFFSLFSFLPPSTPTLARTTHHSPPQALSERLSSVLSAPARLPAVSDHCSVAQHAAMMSTFSLPQMGNKQSKFFFFLVVAAFITFLIPFYNNSDLSIFKSGGDNDASKPPPKVVSSKPPPPMDTDYDEVGWEPPKPHKDLKLEDDPVREHDPSGMGGFCDSSSGLGREERGEKKTHNEKCSRRENNIGAKHGDSGSTRHYIKGEDGADSTIEIPYWDPTRPLPKWFTQTQEFIKRFEKEERPYPFFDKYLFYDTHIWLGLNNIR